MLYKTCKRSGKKEQELLKIADRTSKAKMQNPKGGIYAVVLLKKLNITKKRWTYGKEKRTRKRSECTFD